MKLATKYRIIIISSTSRYVAYWYADDVLQDNLRVDGRARGDYRCMEVETDVVSSASGSARVRLVGI